MLQQINFYTEEFYPRRAKYTAQHLLWITASCALICTLWSLSLLLTYLATQGRLTVAQQQLTQAEANVDENRRLYPPPVLDAQLQAELEKLQLINQQQGGLLAYLNQQQNARGNKPYSGLLRALSAVHQPGLWLSEIKILSQGNALTLSGFTQQAEALPAYLKKLSRHGQFKGQGFALIDIHQQDAVYVFTVSSQYETDYGAGALDKFITPH